MAAEEPRDNGGRCRPAAKPSRAQTRDGTRLRSSRVRCEGGGWRGESGGRRASSAGAVLGERDAGSGDGGILLYSIFGDDVDIEDDDENGFRILMNGWEYVLSIPSRRENLTRLHRGRDHSEDRTASNLASIRSDQRFQLLLIERDAALSDPLKPDLPPRYLLHAIHCGKAKQVGLGCRFNSAAVTRIDHPKLQGCSNPH